MALKFIERRRIIKKLDAMIAEIDINLANNYKSTAHDARRRLNEAVETLGEPLTESDIAKYRAAAYKYNEMMKNYRH